MVLLKLMEALANERSTDAPVNVEGQGGGEGAAEAKGTLVKEGMAGGVFLCSVPPSGNDAMTKRFMKEVGAGYSSVV